MQEIINKLLKEMEGDICELQMSAEKACVMANNITNDYFCDVDLNTVDGKAQICYYFDSTRIKHDILFDYVREAEKQAKTINQIWEKLFDVIHGKTNNIGGNL